MCIPATAPPEHPYTDPWYDRFWDAAQQLQMPLTMHIFTGATANHGVNHAQAGYALAFTGVMFSIADLILSGVCERFPDLTFVPTEFETGWVGIMLRRLDSVYERRGGHKAPGHPPRLPSDYWKQNFLVTFEDDEIGVMTRHISGHHTLMWGNDYPHGDSVFPHSQKVLDEIMADCTASERFDMTARNVVDLYDLAHFRDGWRAGRRRDDGKPISADSHAVEGPEVFDRLAARFGDDAPRVVSRGTATVTTSWFPARGPKGDVNVGFMALAATRLDRDGAPRAPARAQAGDRCGGRPRDPGLPHRRLRGDAPRGSPTARSGPTTRMSTVIAAEVLYPATSPCSATRTPSS